MLVIRANWVHGFTPEDEQHCGQILQNPAVAQVVTLASYPPRLQVSLIADATSADAETLVELLATVPHLADVAFHDQLPQPRGPLPPARKRLAPNEFKPPS